MGVTAAQARAAGCLNTVLADAIGVFICGAFIAGVNVNWRGLLVAVAVISLPGLALELYIDRASGKYSGRDPRLSRFATGFAAASLWLLVGPAVADWATPDFNVGGAWQYLFVVAILFLIAQAYWRLVVLGKRLIARKA